MEYWREASDRAGNDAANKIRETHLLNLGTNLDHEFSTLKTKWMEVLYKLCPDAARCHMTRLAGRRHHHDFDLEFRTVEGHPIKTVKLEFKFGPRRITDLPQVLQIPAPEYAEFFWDRGYVQRYRDLDPEIPEPPERALYLKEVRKVTSSVPFFATAKERETFFREAKFALVNESITEFLNEFRNKIQLMDHVRKTQSDKVFLMWSVRDQKFTTDELGPGDFEISGDPTILNGNVLALGPWRFLLRWKNHKGILNPAWQIKISERSSPVPS